MHDEGPFPHYLKLENTRRSTGHGRKMAVLHGRVSVAILFRVVLLSFVLIICRRRGKGVQVNTDESVSPHFLRPARRRDLCSSKRRSFKMVLVLEHLVCRERGHRLAPDQIRSGSLLSRRQPQRDPRLARLAGGSQRIVAPSSYTPSAPSVAVKGDRRADFDGGPLGASPFRSASRSSARSIPASSRGHGR
jgi:hypothetical protein